MTEAFEKLVWMLDCPMFVVTTRPCDASGGCLVGFANQVSIRPPRFLVGLSKRNHTYRVANDANLSLVSGALVRRIVIRDGAAVRVEYEHRGRTHAATARREIVLSAGAYGTPQLLQLSGVGPAEHLRSVGIDTAVDSPRVGHNLTDHPATFMNWELAPDFPGLSDARNPKWLLRWLIRRSGKLTSNLRRRSRTSVRHRGWLRRTFS
jgi:choline dehydrogenase-like flavoprotein